MPFSSHTVRFNVNEVMFSYIGITLEIQVLVDHLADQLDEDAQMSEKGLSHSFTAFPHRGAKSGRAPQKALSSSSLVFSPTTPSHSPLSSSTNARDRYKLQSF